MNRSITKVLCAAAGLLASAGVLIAEETAQKGLHIEAQPLSSALREYSEQTGLQIGYAAELAKGKETAGVAGVEDPEVALDTLLAQSGLEHRFVNAETVVIQAAPALVSSDEAADSGNARTAPRPGMTAQASERKQRQPTSRSSPVNSSSRSENRNFAIEEIIVTAQKREQRAFDVPMSIVVLGADELQNRQATSLDDLSLAVPGLVVQSVGHSRRILLRGVSNLFGSSSLIGLYLDEASVTSGPFTQLDLRTYDLERVEVLRGPQGTLYGEGSAGGTIRFITKDPVLDRFAMEANAAALFTQDGAPGGRIEWVLNAPLIEDELGLRFAGTFDHQDGWMDQPAASRKNFNDQNLLDVRIKGLWQPAPQFAVNAMAVIHRNDTATNTGEDADGNYTQVFNLTTTPSVKDDYNIYNLTLTYDFASVRVLSATSSIEYDAEIRNVGQRFQVTPPGTPRFHFYTPLVGRSADTFAQELRLTSIGFGPWQWTAGGFYRHARRADGSVPAAFFGLPGPPGTPLPPPLASSSTSHVSNSWAVFGDTSYKLTDRLTLGAGLRYSEDERRFTSRRGPGETTQLGTFDTLNPRIYAQYELTDNINTYASASNGFRSGGFNQLNQPTFDPETVWTYELGTKMLLLDGRLSADVAVFYSDYTDYQISGIVLDPPVNITSNAGNARIEGIEWGLTWRPADQWSLSFNGHFVDSKFDEINATSSSHAVGDPLDGFPEYGYTMSVQRDFELSGRLGFARLDYNEQGRMTYRIRSIGPWYFDESDVINMLNFHISMQWNNSLSLGLFGQNLLNDRGFINPFSIEEVAARSRPRTFGIEFGVTF